MKKYAFTITAIIITGIAFAGFSIGMGAKAPAPANNGILSVNAIQADPNAFTGIITINGVVSGFSRQNPKIFTIVDTAEVKLCRTVTCGRFYLPVMYDGPAPIAGDEVNVTGTFAGAGKELIFNAQKAEVLRHLSY